jgi:predicted secreted Zn-dependent protease
MQPLYIILLILLTVILNIAIMLLMPYVKQYWNTFISGIKRKLKRKPDTRLNDIEEQLNNLAKRLKTRETGDRELIRKTVREYLEELKSK